MNIRLHKNARTTHAIRKGIQEATESDYELAARFGVTRGTIRRGRKCTTQQDGSHTAHRLPITLNTPQENFVVKLRTTLRLLLDDPFSVVRELIHADMGRSALDRCCVVKAIRVRRSRGRLRTPHRPSRPTCTST